MLTIRSQQMRVFQKEFDRQFCRETAAGLRLRHPAATTQLSDTQLLHRVEVALERGRSHGLETRMDLGSFIALMVVIGPVFDLHPSVGAILNDGRFSATERIDLLFLRLRPVDWREVQAFALAQPWPERIAVDVG
jgi:hypothetical protein